MSEWSVIFKKKNPLKHSVFTAPDEHMPYIIQLHIMSIRWAYYEEGRGSEGSRKDWAELYGCIKQVSNDHSLQWQSLENLNLSLCLRETENWNSSFKTLFHKDCSLGSVKNPSNN